MKRAVERFEYTLQAQQRLHTPTSRLIASTTTVKPRKFDVSAMKSIPIVPTPLASAQALTQKPLLGPASVPAADPLSTQDFQALERKVKEYMINTQKAMEKERSELMSKYAALKGECEID